MISARSLQWFVLMNSLLVGAGTLEYTAFYALNESLPLVFCVAAAKNIGLAWVIGIMNESREYITPGPRRLRSSPNDIYHMVQGAAIETVGFAITHTYMLERASSIAWELAWFIPLSFVFEIIFDFFHYWTHRIGHARSIYPFMHKWHHQHNYITTHISFQHTLLDVLFTNLLPILITVRLIPATDYFMFLFLWYKTFTEVGGHLGKDTKGSCFTQCIWLPRLLGIELRQRDHNLHHAVYSKNFSKRFSLWDKVFGTFAR